MIKKDIHLVGDLFDQEKLEKKPTREGYGQGLVEVGEKNPRVVVLSADLTESTRAHLFAQRFPDRFIEVGIAEQNLATVASGMAAVGKVPFISSYATFSPGRNWEQIRTTIAYNNVPVKIAGAHAGISVGPDGATHQALEDIAIMRAMPNMTVVIPADMEEARKATIAAAGLDKPVYLRFARSATPVFTTAATPFRIGRAEVYHEGKNATIIACGPLVHNALLAAFELEKEGVSAEVINCHTVKPLDRQTILKSVKKTRAVVSVEEHQITGGLGGAVSELLAHSLPAPQEFIGVQDRFGESGSPEELIEAFGMGVDEITKAVKRAVGRR